MIKVIQPAERDSWRVTCHHCKAVLEFNKIDVKIFSIECAGVAWELEARIECPECEANVLVTERISDNMFSKMCEVYLVKMRGF